ncbi:MAG: tetratricopeptide repeat protein [Bacteroidales bacterium]|nr:tetratricopeptide repeat protein [Bacteroidales bacterium]
MKKFLVIVLTTVMSIGLAWSQVDESKKEYFHALDSVMSLTETNPTAALELCKQIQEKWGLASDLMYCKGACYFYMQNYEAASMEFAHGASLWKKDDYFRIGAYYRALAAILQEVGDYSNAIKQVNKGIKQDKKYYTLYYMRGECYQELEQYKKAISDFKKASADEDLFCDAKAGIALCYANLGNIAQAKKALEESIARNTYHAESRRLRAMIALSEARFENFIDDYMLFMQINKPTSPTNIFGLCRNKKYHDYAMHYAEEILKGQSDSIGEAYWEWAIGNIEINYGNEPEMWRHAQKAREMNPGNIMLDTKICQQYAIHYNSIEDLDNLLIIIDTLIARDDENDYKIHTARGKLLEKQKKYEEAIVSYEKALEMIIDDKEDKKWVLYQLANIYHKQLKDADKTIACYDSLLALDPEATSTMYQVAKIYMQMKKDTAKANEIFNSIIEIEKDIEDYTNAYSQFAFAQLGRFEEAEAFQKKIDEFIEKADKLMKGVLYYNAACLYSIISKEDLAIERLMSAIDEGIGTCDMLKTDEDFKNIRESDGFKAIEKMVCLAEEE